jgi:glucan phosphoethanolaminetransferase (alkaline phosphatase superfamily)
VTTKSEADPSVAVPNRSIYHFGLSLFCVLAVAKVLMVIGRDLSPFPLTVIVFLWQDAVLAVAGGAVLALLACRWPAASWSCYGLLAFYAAMNVPLARALGTPLTWQMSQATGTALADSIRHYFTPINFVLITAVVFTALVAPFCFKALSSRFRFWPVIAAIPLIIVGIVCANRFETAGMDRNPVIAFIGSCFPQVKAAESHTVWRQSDSVLYNEPDLTEFRASMTGRNVIVIALESTGARYLGLYGAATDPTPNLSALARDAIIAEHAYAVYPESIKGLFSLLFSRYPAFDTSVEQLARHGGPSLVQALRFQGYETALFHSGRFMYLGMDTLVERSGFDLSEDAGAISGQFNSSFGVDEPSTVQQILGWIDQRQQSNCDPSSAPAGSHRKFFITYLPIAGHHPYDTPERGPFSVHREQDRYLNALHYGDQSLGTLFDGLKQRGLFTNTVFVVFGDHGEAFGQHDGNFAHTLFLYEENVRVPFLIAAPGALSGQTRLKRPLSLIDTAPTLLELLGLALPPEFQGESRLGPTTRLSLFYTDYSLPLVGLRDGDWKYIGEVGGRRNQLYNLASDPNETTNLSAQFPGRVSAYRQRLEQWSAAQKQLYCD